MPAKIIISQSFNTVSNLPLVNIDHLTEVDVFTALKKLKNKMMSGHDQIASFVLKDCAAVSLFLYSYCLIN